jgi:hypothetical protein
MVSIVLRNIQSEMFVIRNLSYRSVIHKNVRMIRFVIFKIFINDIVIDIQSTIKLFADDTSLYLIIDNPKTTTDILNRDLDKIHTWSTNWLVSLILTPIQKRPSYTN